MKGFPFPIMLALLFTVGCGLGEVQPGDLDESTLAAKNLAGKGSGGAASHPGDDPAPIEGEPSNWSFFFYMAVDNELEDAGLLTIDRLLEATAALENHARILVLLDVLSEPGIEIFEINRGVQVPVTHLDERLSSDPALLQDFLAQGLSDFAGEQNALIIKSEGFGWRGIGRDNTHAEDEFDGLMSIDGMAHAIEAAKAATGRSLDMLILEGSEMAMIEVVYELRNAADLLLASQTKIQFEGIPWHMIITDLGADGDMPPIDLGVLIADDHKDYWDDKGNLGDPAADISANFASMSVLDLSKISAAVAAYIDYANVIVPLFPELHNILPHARDLSDIGGYGEITDYDFNFDIVRFQNAALMLIEEKGLSYPQLEQAIADYQVAHYDMLLYEFHADKYQLRPNGMSIWYPPTYNKYITWDPVGEVAFGSTFIYHDQDLDWVDDSNWLWYLDEYYRATYNASPI